MNRPPSPWPRLLSLLVSAGLMLMPPPAAAADATELVERAEALLRAGQAAQAFSLLAPLEAAEAGNVRFDYALALAALDSGRAEFASIILERVLAVDPNFAGARIDMGRAYFQMGDYIDARIAFEKALEQDPPPAARSAIDRYLAEIQSRRSNTVGYVELSLGRDTDVNSSTAQAQIAVPALGNAIFSLNPSALKTADNFGEIAAGAETTLPLAGDWSVYAGADARYRGNQHAAPFNFGSVELRTGLSRSSGDTACRIGVVGGDYTLGRARNRESAGVVGELRIRADNTNLVSLFGQDVRQRFPSPSLSANDFDQPLVGGAWTHLLGAATPLSFGVFGGSEHAVNGRADGDKRIRGFRVGAQTTLDEETTLFGNLGWQVGQYNRINPAFLLVRRDVQADLTVGVGKMLGRNWSLRGQLTRLLNISNLPIYPYERDIAAIGLRYDFR